MNISETVGTVLTVRVIGQKIIFLRLYDIDSIMIILYILFKMLTVINQVTSNSIPDVG